MNEEIEYAEMLEIPVSTVNVIRKNERRRKKKSLLNEESKPLKEAVIDHINERIEGNESEISVDAELFAEGANSQGELHFDPIPDRIDTVRVYSTNGPSGFWDDSLHPQDIPLNTENEAPMYETTDNSHLGKILKNTLNGEFIASCALCGAIFLTNVFMPTSAITTFFRAISNPPEIASADTRTYMDFDLESVVSDFSDAKLTLSPSGILTFTHACCVYPSADAKVAEIEQNGEGLYAVKLQYSDSFTGVMQGLNNVYYEVGDSVKAHVPIGYTDGSTEVQGSMYSDGTLLNCFELTEENCLAWVEQSEE